MNLKKLIFVLCLCHITFTIGFAQKSDQFVVKFSYDLNGNRVQRWVEVLKIVTADTVDSLHQDSLIKNNITNSGVLNGTISIFPNPTEGLLDMKITGMKAGETAEYVFASLTGQELLHKKTYSPLTKIDISIFAPGTYIMVVRSGTQTGKWKIIKQQ